MNSSLSRPSETQIHPTAVVSSTAKLGTGCIIEAYTYIGDEVVLKDDVHVKPFASITGATIIGNGTTIFQYACVGEIPQDLKYDGEKTKLIIGKRNKIREGATLNTGTKGGGGITRVGDDCLFMTGSHVGHDVQVGNNVILANQVALGGHCIIEDDVRISGLSGVHQFVRIGKGAFISAVTLVRKDVIPYGYVDNPMGDLVQINLPGLRRNNISSGKIMELKQAFEFLSNSNSLMHAIEELRQKTYSGDSLVPELIRFCSVKSKREYLNPTSKPK